VYSERKNEPDFASLGQIEPTQGLSQLNIERSTIGLSLSMTDREYCVADAGDLIDWVASQIETRGCDAKFDQQKFERLCRDEIEATGNPTSGASLANKVMADYSKDLPEDTVPKNKAEEITSKLIREYVSAK
jgi:hypothetical protein